MRRPDITDYRRDRVLALAGVFQAARLVQQLARHGRSDDTALAASIGSVLQLECTSTEEIYGGVKGVTLGLELLRNKLAGRAEASDVELARYVVGVLRLERALERNTPMLAAIRRGIESLKVSDSHSDTPAKVDQDSQLVTKLAELYRMTLSTLTPRIIVNGEHGHLRNDVIAGRVRSALFAGIRSAFLWRQLGGRRWQLVLRKTAIARQAAHILEQPSA